MKILLTGQPHAGKTTLITRIVECLSAKQGFLTREIPNPAIPGERLGFELIDHAGRTGLLAHVASHSTIRVSRYGVEITSLDKFIEPLYYISPTKVLYIDELGQMELYSDSIKNLVNMYLVAPNDFIGTMTSVYSDSFLNKIRKDSRIEVIEVTLDNRDSLLGKITKMLR